MRARVVLGANLGDEGKGLIVDYLCAKQGAGIVVRSNGGSQSGHTVVTPDGKRHVFHHFGAGAFCNIPTFLSQFFVCNPLAAMFEINDILELDVTPILYAHPNCLVTTFADMMINQQIENARGDKRHGSIGLGFFETIVRSDVEELKITMSDLWNNISLEDRLKEICTRWAEFRTGKEIDKPDAMIQNYIYCCSKFAENVHPLGIAQCQEPIFEGGQGLLLDQDNKEFFPHLTRSHTGMKNVRLLCEQANINDVDIYYVSRTYMTRHGAGPLPGEDPLMNFYDNTNLEHEYQGKIRFAPLDVNALMARCQKDAGTQEFKLVLTHCDQLPAPCSADFYANGPTRDDIDEAILPE